MIFFPMAILRKPLKINGLSSGNGHTLGDYDPMNAARVSSALVLQ
jgi:hypothetical protein